MPLPHRLLQIGTLTLFCSMIVGLVVFQSGTLIQGQPTVVQDSLPPVTWFDSAQFQKDLIYARTWRFPGSKMAIVFKPSDGFLRQDTLLAMDLIRMRYEVGKLPDMLVFQMQCNERTAGRKGNWISTYDSLEIWKEMKVHPHRVAQLTSSEKQRFQTILDSLLRPRLMSSKSGIIFRHTADTMQALQILTAPPIPK